MLKKSQSNLMERLSRETWAVGGQQCAGCGSNIAANLVLRHLAKRDDAIVWGGACGFGRLPGGVIQLGSHGADLTGADEALRARGETDKKLILIAGEGSSYEIGLTYTVGFLTRQQRGTLIVINNETYAMSGYHHTNVTPFKASSKAVLNGRDHAPANLPLALIFLGAQYVATASISHPEDLLKKIDRALKHQPSVVDIHCPCESGWRYSVGRTIELSRLAVRSGMYTLWEYDGGAFRRTLKVLKRVPVGKYTAGQRRFAHLTPQDHAELQTWVDQRNTLLTRMEQAFADQSRS